MGDGSFRALVPFLDMCNHEPESPVQYAVKWAELEQRLGVDCDAPPSPWRLTEEGSIELLAERATRKGEQVLVPYGEETSSELLCTSGFVPSPNSAEYLTLFDGVVDPLAPGGAQSTQRAAAFFEHSLGQGDELFGEHTDNIPQVVIYLNPAPPGQPGAKPAPAIDTGRAAEKRAAPVAAQASCFSV